MVGCRILLFMHSRMPFVACAKALGAYRLQLMRVRSIAEKSTMDTETGIVKYK